MFGVGKKNIEPINDQNPKLTVYTIPKEFYAGANPVIKFNNVEKLINNNRSAEVVVAPTKPVVVEKLVQKKVPEKTSKVNKSLKSKKTIVIATTLLFLVFVGAASLYYLRVLKKQPVEQKPIIKTPQQITNNNPTPSTTPVIIEPVTTTPEITTSTETEIPTTTPALSGDSIEFPSILLGNSADLDNDKVTDAEEDLFGTDPGKADTDSDGYEDSTEIYHLYSPTQFAPVRMMGTGVVKEFTNPIFGYKIYYPSTWTEGSVDNEYRQMLFSTISGEYVEVRVLDKTPGQKFEDWFTSFAKGEQLGALKDFQTVFKESGKMRSDNLVYYFEDERRRYVIVYHITGSGSANYRNIITMLARSFRTQNNSNAVLPEQKVIRELPSDTASQ